MYITPYGASGTAIAEHPRPRSASEAALTVIPASDQLRLALSGDLDLATAERLTALLTWLEGTPRAVRLNLSGVSFVDSAGLAPLLDSAQRRRHAGLPPLILVDASRKVRRLLDVFSDDPGVRALETATAR
jgi:anti-anti-sigma factor